MLQDYGNRSADICLVMHAVGQVGYYLSMRILRFLWQSGNLTGGGGLSYPVFAKFAQKVIICWDNFLSFSEKPAESLSGWPKM